MLHIRYNLKDLREKANLSIRELANLTEISSSQLSRIERNESNPTLLTAVIICDALNVKLEKFYEIK